MRKAIKSFLETLEDRRNPTIERAYEKLSEHVKSFRQALAQMIATENQLKEQIEKNKAHADVWKEKAENGTGPVLIEQALMRKKQYEDAYYALEIQLRAGEPSITQFRDKLSDLERPLKLIYLLKSLLSTFPEVAKTPPELREKLRELFDTIRKFLMEQKGSDGKSEGDQPTEQKIADYQLIELINRTAEAFKIFVAYYSLHPEDQQAVLLADRVSDCIETLETHVIKDREHLAIWTERAQKSRDRKDDNQHLIEMADKRVIEYGFIVFQYDEVLTILSTASEKLQQSKSG